MNTKRAFTLIELLVVIAIIAILAAILFPVFAQARESARKTACLSNVKQIGMSVHMYLEDNDETFWTWAWGYYCNGENGGRPGNSGAFWAAAIYPYAKNTAIFRCPDDVIQDPDDWARPSQGCAANLDDGVNDPFSSRYPGNYNSYGVPELLDAWWDTGNAAWHPVKEATIRYPANHMLLADCQSQLGDIWSNSWPDGWSQPTYIAARVAFTKDNFGDWNMPWQSQHTAAYFINKYGASTLDSATRHSGGGNITYVDGHAKYSKWTSMTWQNLTIGQNQ